jgi:hypothetical protein
MSCIRLSPHPSPGAASPAPFVIRSVFVFFRGTNNLPTLRETGTAAIGALLVDDRYTLRVFMGLLTGQYRLAVISPDKRNSGQS